MLKQYNYSILSKYRTELMGVSILWVMFFIDVYYRDNITYVLNYIFI